MSLASRRLDKRMYLDDEGLRPNPGFRETHLSNPLKCRYCGKKFYVFAGVEYEIEEGRPQVRDIDIAVAREGTPGLRGLFNWPHKGLVMREVLEYTPHRVRVFESLDALERYYGGKLDDIVSSSLSDEDRDESGDEPDYTPLKR